MPSHEASMANLAKARQKSPWLRPWRSSRETDLLRRLTWQWCRGRCLACSGRELARQLGVSHTWIQKLKREYWRDPAVLQDLTFRHGMATLGQFHEAQEQTYSQRMAGVLRRRISWRRAERSEWGDWKRRKREYRKTPLRAVERPTSTRPEQPTRVWDEQARSWRVDYPAGNAFLDRLTGAR